MLLSSEDITLQISELLTDKEKILLSMVSKLIDKLKHKFIFREKINMIRIKNLPYFNNFEFVEITDTMLKLGLATCVPNNIKYVHHKAHTINIIPFATHVTFGSLFNQSIKDSIPRSATHLTFGDSFNQLITSMTSPGHIIQHIPNSVTHLEFGCDFNQSIKNAIPNSVTHLTFGDYFFQQISGCIPDSVTNLKIGWYYGQQISIPQSVTQILLPMGYNKRITCNPTTKILFYDRCH